KLKHLIERPQKNEIGDWNEIDNREELLKKAQELGADWALALDPDERFENNFLANLRHIVETSDKNTVFGLRFRELWDDYDQFRVDGVWGQKQRFCLFPLNHEIVFEAGRQKLHWRWYPDSLAGHERLLDYDMYHLKMVTPQARVKRAEHYNSLDPEKQYQAIGYDYLVDEEGLSLQKVSTVHAYDYESINPELKAN
ncbi:MAG: hypothetical protein IKZ87_09035, partial [Actinomycetaceae bacterium]|nr:hypothetical protein [Actinomycetaceae bacterium]